ncbi:hypothetical protein ACP70R_033992 [Stipagrostis hirtigluma subsp. patula]
MFSIYVGILLSNAKELHELELEVYTRTCKFWMDSTDDPLSLDGGVQTMPKVEDAPAAAVPPEFDPDRIPASIFHPRTSSAQADWSVASNESLFSIQGTSQHGDLGLLYCGSRSHFDYFYNEAMAVAAGAEGDSKLLPLAEGLKPGDWNEAMPIWWGKVEGCKRDGGSEGRAREGGDGERRSLCKFPERRRRDTERERIAIWMASLLHRCFALFLLFLAGERRKASLLEML